MNRRGKRVTSRDDLRLLEAEEIKLERLLSITEDSNKLAAALGKTFQKPNKVGILEDRDMMAFAKQFESSPVLQKARERLVILREEIEKLKDSLGGEKFSPKFAMSDEARKQFEEDFKAVGEFNAKKQFALEELEKRRIELITQGWDYEEERLDHLEKMRLQAAKNYLADNRFAINTLTAGFYGMTNGLEQGLTKAFQNSFGEANSLLEQFVLAAAQRGIFELASLAIGVPGGGGIIGSIFGGATGGSRSTGGRGTPEVISGGGGRTSQPIIVNLEIGRKQMRAIVNDAMGENIRLRMA